MLGVSCITCHIQRKTKTPDAVDENRRIEKRELQRSREARWRDREVQVKAETEERKAKEAELLLRKQKAAEERIKVQNAAAAKRVRSGGAQSDQSHFDVSAD